MPPVDEEGELTTLLITVASPPSNAELREDGFYELKEDFNYELREGTGGN